MHTAQAGDLVAPLRQENGCRGFQTPPDVGVKCQTFDITEIIL
jgi:hypothetical protein